MTAEREGLRRIAIVLAGGVGVRAGLGMPKQLARIAGTPIIEHTLAAIDSSPDIDEIIVMMEPGSLAYAEELVASGRFPKLRAAFEGGATRNDSTRLALAQIPDSEAKVLIHDAVRPFVDHRILGACVAALDAYGAVDTAIPSADTIVEVDDDGLIVDVPPRARLRRSQTPQAFRLSVIRAAYAAAALDPGFTATDDCTVVLRYTPGVPIVVVDGSDANMKITEPIDVFIADHLLQLASSEPPGVDPAARERAVGGTVLVVFGGSDGIGAAIAEAAERFGATMLS